MRRQKMLHFPVKHQTKMVKGKINCSFGKRIALNPDLGFKFIFEGQIRMFKNSSGSETLPLIGNLY
jgi:hypothetical protein